MEIPRFVKWAGGKLQLIEQYKPLFPRKFNQYFEPFAGSAAVAFHIIQNYNPKYVLLSDINEELINAFEVIKTDVEALISELKRHKELHVSDAKGHYYTTRAQNPHTLSQIKQAARFVYLNRTCFNGLYRVNSKGEFNVPMGSYKNPDFVQEDKLRKISQMIQHVNFKVMPFENIVNIAEKGDFVYLDPPYYPLKKTGSFTKYAKNDFLEKEQEKLAEVFKKLTEKGCYCMESNSDTEYIHNLYKEYKIHTVQATRAINSKADRRGKISEVVITNY